MKFKVSFLNNVDVKETLCAVGWNSSDEVFCCGLVTFKFTCVIPIFFMIINM